MEIENICIPRCPKCNVAIEHAEGCAAMKCSRPGCGCAICAYCFQDCGDDAHEHVDNCPEKGEVQGYGGPLASNDVLQKISKLKLKIYWKSVEKLVKEEALRDYEIRGWLEKYQIV